MIKIRTVLQYTGAAAATKKDLHAAVKAELHGLGEFWHDKYLPLHFEPSAYSRYGGIYKRRSPKYVRRKGHNKPMVMTGTMRRQALAFALVRATPNRTTVGFTTPRALNFSSRPNYPDLRAELTAVNAAEAQTFANRLDAGVARYLETQVKPKRRGRATN